MSWTRIEEWSVETIGGGITGTHKEVERWIKGWRIEHGDQYEIHVRRRIVKVTPWENVDIASFDK